MELNALRELLQFLLGSRKLVDDIGKVQKLRSERMGDSNVKIEIKRIRTELLNLEKRRRTKKI
jgi:hypothetical protein